MALPILIFVACFGVGFAAAVHFLPPLSDEPVGMLAGFVAAGLLGVALAAVGLELYLLGRDLHNLSVGTGPTKGELIADRGRTALYDGGVLTGLAFIVYLLAQRTYGDARRR
jgi:hypothetical protein